MSIRNQPHYSIRPARLAEWLDRDPNAWWIVHGEDRLVTEVDFPCPVDELTDALRHHEEPLFIAPGPRGTAVVGDGSEIDSDRLDDVLSFSPDGTRLLVLCWADLGDDWLLSEYPNPELNEVAS